MPTYDYRCLCCGYEFEEFQKMSDEPLKKCPECSGSVKRLIGAGLGPIFKGTGFYQTDYKSNKPSNGNNGTKTEKKETSSSTSNSTPAKTESSD